MVAAWIMAVAKASAAVTECLVAQKVKFAQTLAFVRGADLRCSAVPIVLAPRARCVGRVLVDQAMGLSARRMPTARTALYVVNSVASTKAAVIP